MVSLPAGPMACVFFILVWIICSCIMLNLFIAVILENFSIAGQPTTLADGPIYFPVVPSVPPPPAKW